MSSLQLYPEVKDGSGLGPKFSRPQFHVIGIEGQAGASGTTVVGRVEEISRPTDADTLFGTTSSLAMLVKFVLARGIPSVKAVASVKGSYSAESTERQTAWQNLESDPDVRLRLTDAVTQSILDLHATSAENANIIQNKQVAFGGMPTGTSKAALISAAGAVNSKRGVLVGPGVHDEGGVLLAGPYAAGAVVARVALNPDPSDDLDTVALHGLTGIEKDGMGMPIFRQKVVAGAEVNDYSDLLVGGVSPLRTGRRGGVEITHLRTTYTADSTFDALSTLMIIDEVFIRVRDYCERMLFLRKGNTAVNRNLLQSGIQALLNELQDWLEAKQQVDGTTGFNVAVTASADKRQMIVSYEGEVLRGVQTILIAGNLSIAA